MPDTSDAQLVSACRSGNQEAYKELVTRYQGHVYGLAYSLVDDWAEAQDLAQETFIRAYTNLDQLHEPARFAAWLRRVTFSVTMDWLRTFRPGVFRQLDGKIDLDALDIPSFEPGPAETAQKRELADAVLAAVATLPHKYRVPLTMFHLDGLSYQKVADFLDIPLGTAKSMIHRARAKLKDALAVYATEEMVPPVQEVFNEHKLPAEFSQEVWSICMDWLCSVNSTNPVEPRPDQERAERIAMAAARDPDVAAVNEWRQQAEPLPEWAMTVAREMPRWGIEICNHAWLTQLQRLIWMISHETTLPDPPPGECGSEPADHRQWLSMADQVLAAWLDGKPLASDALPPSAEIVRLLGPMDSQKQGAVQLLRQTFGLLSTMAPDEALDAEHKKLVPTTELARQMHWPMSYLRFTCGYRWRQVLLEICRAIGIGDREFQDGGPRAWHVGACNGQMVFVYRDDPMRVPATCGVLVGLWAWLRQVPKEHVAQQYPTLASAAEHIRGQLGPMTAVKRWLAGRFFVGTRMWLQQVDHGDIPAGRPAMESYPVLAGDEP